MKRIWMAVVGALALCISLVACGRGGTDFKANFVGTWEIASLTEDGVETDAETLAAMKDYGLNVYLELNENGSASFELFGEAMEGTWDASSAEKGTVTFEGSSAPMVLGDGRLSMESDNSKLVFEKIDPSQKQTTSGSTGNLEQPEEDPATSEDEPAESQDDNGLEEDLGGLTSWGGDDIDDLDDPTAMGILVVDDDNFTIKILAKGLYVGDPAFYFEVTNKTDAEVGINSVDGTWTVNGEAHDPIVLESISAGETLGTIGWFSADEIGTDMNALGTIKGQLEMYNEDYETLATYDVTID